MLPATDDLVVVIERPSKDVSLKDIIEAIEKNGIPHVRNTMFSYKSETNKITGGCAMGQAIINLGVSKELFYLFAETYRDEFQSRAREVPIDYISSHAISNISDRIAYLNDSRLLSLSEIADQLREDYAPMLDLVVDVPTETYDLAIPNVDDDNTAQV